MFSFVVEWEWFAECCCRYVDKYSGYNYSITCLKQIMN